MEIHTNVLFVNTIIARQNVRLLCIVVKYGWRTDPNASFGYMDPTFWLSLEGNRPAVTYECTISALVWCDRGKSQEGRPLGLNPGTSKGKVNRTTIARYQTWSQERVGRVHGKVYFSLKYHFSINLVWKNGKNSVEMSSPSALEQETAEFEVRHVSRSWF